MAKQSADGARLKQKKHYDLKTRGAEISMGDRVLVKRVAFDGKHKLADKWEEEVYTVVEKPNSDIPVYVVQTEDKQKKRTLHRNLLLPIGNTVLERTETGDSDTEELEVAIPFIVTEQSKSNTADTGLTVTFPAELAGQREDAEVAGVSSELQDTEVAQDDAGAAEVETEAADDRGTPEDEEQESEQSLASENGADSGESDEEEEDVKPRPQPAPRRSVRERKPPPWLASGDFQVLSQELSEPNWLELMGFFMSKLDAVSQGQFARQALEKMFSNAQ